MREIVENWALRKTGSRNGSGKVLSSSFEPSIYHRSLTTFRAESPAIGSYLALHCLEESKTGVTGDLTGEPLLAMVLAKAMVQSGRTWNELCEETDLLIEVMSETCQRLQCSRLADRHFTFGENSHSS